MVEKKNNGTTGESFLLDKWFLDFVGKNGETMIFYAAKLTWRGWSASYTSWLHYNSTSGTILKSRFTNIQMPQINDELITWNDEKFGISGTWKSLEKMIQARIYDSDKGFLDWKCYQPASKVFLRINERVMEGRGYAEQLILTVPPWKISMDELRWGRFGSDKYNIVWIELRKKVIKQWLWLNGEKIENCIIEDDHLSIPVKDLILNLDRQVVLESEKKIYSVVEKLIRYIPGFNKLMPLSFLMADEYKWLSNGKLQMHGKILDSGLAIHEFVNFKTL